MPFIVLLFAVFAVSLFPMLAAGPPLTTPYLPRTPLPFCFDILSLEVMFVFGREWGDELLGSRLMCLKLPLFERRDSSVGQGFYAARLLMIELKSLTRSLGPC